MSMSINMVSASLVGAWRYIIIEILCCKMLFAQPSNNSFQKVAHHQ